MSTCKRNLDRPVSVGVYLSMTHPLAVMAQLRCSRVHGDRRRVLACGPCWEHVIRTDAVVAAEGDLPAFPVADPDLVDEVAVDRACAGLAVPLTAAEVVAVVRRLRAHGIPFSVIGERLGRDPEALRHLTHPGDGTPSGGSGVAA